MQEDFFIIHTFRPEDRMVAQVLRKTHKKIPSFELIFNAQDYNEQVKEVISSFKIAQEVAFLMGSHVSLDVLASLCNRVEAGVTLITWDKARDTLKYESLLAQDPCRLTMTTVQELTANCPDWVQKIAAINLDTPEIKHLYRGLIHQSRAQGVSLSRVYSNLWEGQGPSQLELQKSGQVIYEHESKMSQEVVEGNGHKMVTAKGTRVCIVMGAFSPIEPYVTAALESQISESTCQIGITVRYGYDQSKGLCTTYLSAGSHPEGAHLLDFINAEPFSGGGRPTFRGCRFYEQLKFAEIVDRVFQHA